MVRELYTTVIAGIATFSGAFAGWYFRRRSERADAKTKEIDNEIKLSEYYKDLLDGLSERYEKKFTEVIGLFELKIKVLNNEIAFMKKENIALRKRVKEFENERSNHNL